MGGDISTSAELPKDVVIDVMIMRLYDNPADPKIRALFKWLADIGTLAISQRLLTEYGGIGNLFLAPFIDRLTKENRLNRIGNGQLNSFKADRHFNYTCNRQDHDHARLVFLSVRKILVSVDNNLVADINNFRRVGGVKPKATKSPDPDFYE